MSVAGPETNGLILLLSSLLDLLESKHTLTQPHKPKIKTLLPWSPNPPEVGLKFGLSVWPFLAKNEKRYNNVL